MPKKQLHALRLGMQLCVVLFMLYSQFLFACTLCVLFAAEIRPFSFRNEGNTEDLQVLQSNAIITII